MPFGNDCEFENMDSCILMHVEDGHTQEEAEQMCATLMEETEGMCEAKARARQAGPAERRFVSTEMCPVTVEERDGESYVTGYASVFFVPDDAGTEYQLFSDLKERIMPRAFNKALQEKHDAAALFNHDVNYVLGRVSAGTLRLSKDQRGLRYEVKPPASRADVVESIRRRDVKGSSFGFRVLEQKFKTEGGMDVREIYSVELLDVSPVVYPAYTGTSAGVRALGDVEEVRTAHQVWKAEEARKAALVEKLTTIKAQAEAFAALE